MPTYLEPRDARVRVVDGLGSRDPIAVVVLYGEHDYASREVLEDALEPIASNVLVDLSWCAFLDSSIVAVILAKHAELEAQGRWLELVVPSRHTDLARAIDRLGVSQLLAVREPAPPVP
jgi:anti-anti-sigma regulatory factor